MAAKYYRYSIPELLDISTRITTDFDISRLSFNAVRAGIVPALSNGVMAPAPRDSALRTRGWSQQTSSASDEQPVPRLMEFPLRQPFNAPPERLAQKDEGFANFILTHSSPNSKRVTAGGRIVPMEKRPAPPRFELQAAKDNQNTGIAQSMTGSADCSNKARSPTNISTFGYDVASNSELVPSTISPGVVQAETPSFNVQQAALHANILMQNQLLSYGQGPLNGTMYSATPGMVSQVPIFGQYPMSLHCLPNAPTFVDPNPGLPVAWEADPHVQSAPQAMLTTMLTTANQQFEHLDQQLKDLDRYRATHHRDETLVSQRVGIVARRAEVKEEIRRLHAAISLHENNPVLASVGPPEWLPAGIQHHPMQKQNARGLPLVIKEPSLLKDITSKTKPSKPKPTAKLNVEAAAYVPKAGRYSVVPASELQPTSPGTKYSRIDTGPGSPELKIVDKWGERLGLPSGELLLEQTVMAEHLLSELNTPKVSDDDTSDSGSTKFYNLAGSDGPGSVSNNPNCAPSSVEADYTLQIDAMRKPKGTTSRVTLSDGQVQVIPGLDLKPPTSENMSDFEVAYWGRKPVYSDYKENSRAPSLTTKTSAFSFDQAKAWRGSLQDSPSRQILSELSATIGYNSNPMVSRTNHDEWDAAIRKLQAQAATQDNGTADDHHSVGPGNGNENHDQDALLNKAYSSCASQDIHATASLPRSLDGAVEAKLLKIKQGTPNNQSPKSTKSPRTIFRSAGDAWLGPFRRTFYDSK